MYHIHLVSIVIPTNDGASKINQLAREIIDVMAATIYKFEIVIVNYGNEEPSREIIYQLSDTFSCIKGLNIEGDNSKESALRSGFVFAKGDVILSMDGDLHHDPAYMPVFLAYIERGYDMVCGLRKQKHEHSWKSLLTGITQKMTFLFAGVTLKYLGTTYRAYRRYLPGNVNCTKDTHQFLNALMASKYARIMDVPITFRTENVAFTG
jgi:glycosyltransferase involved in cell wall biosynthesis